MKTIVIPLTMVAPGREVILVSIEAGWGLRRRLTDMGLSEGNKFKLLHVHRNGPCVILAGNRRLALGYGMADRMLVKES